MEQLIKEQKAMAIAIDISLGFFFGLAIILMTRFILFPLFGFDGDNLITDFFIVLFSMASLSSLPSLVIATKLRKKVRQQITELEQKQWQEIYNYK